MTPEQTTPEIRAYIEEQKAKLQIPSYDNVVINQAFKGRTAGMWAGIAMGLTWGAIVGVAAATCVSLIATTATPAILGGIVALCATTGFTVGTLSGQLVGAAAGAVRGGFNEFEKRLKEADIEKALLNDPKLAEKASAAAAVRGSESPLLLKPNRSLRIEEMYMRSNGAGNFLSYFIMPKTMAVSSAAGAIVGGIAMVAAMYAGGGYTGLTQILGDQIGTTAAKIAAGSAVGAASGASFGFNFPAVFTSLTRYAGATLSGSIFTKEWWSRDKAQSVALPEKDIPIIFPDKAAAAIEQTHPQAHVNLDEILANRVRSQQAHLSYT